MNEYLMLGIVGIVAVVAGLGASWVGKALGGNKNKTDKPS